MGGTFSVNTYGDPVYESKSNGMVGIWDATSSTPRRIITTAETTVNNTTQWWFTTSQMTIFLGLVAVGGFIILIGYSFSSGRQDLAGTVTAVGSAAREIGKVATPAGRAASVFSK